MSYDTAFADWANLCLDFASHSITNLGEFRKNVIVDVFNEAGVKALSYTLYRCWVTEYQALPALDASANEVAITTIKLAFEWFERDEAVVEQQGPARIMHGRCPYKPGSPPDSWRSRHNRPRPGSRRGPAR